MFKPFSFKYLVSAALNTKSGSKGGDFSNTAIQ